MSPQEFIAKWQDVTLTERSACQQHFLDLCELLEQPKPASADPQGAFYTFERGVEKSDGGDGWADVWLRGHFGWEYKGKKKSLKTAYDQLLLYRESLENPPLLVVCDLDRFEIHTNFTSTAKRVYAFDLQGLADPDNLDILRKVFTDPDSLRPGQTSQGITEQAAELFGQLADGMRVRGIPASEAAHFLMKLMFCMFAEDIELLPNKVFFRLLTGAKKEPARLGKLLADLFQAMCNGGNFGADEILYFNGGLFADADVIELRPSEIETLTTVAAFDWSVVEPSVFGTLFERTLDPAKRSQIGAHYTGRQDIETLLQPVMMAPLRREWEDVKAKCSVLWRKIAAGGKAASAPKLGPRRTHRAQSPRREKGPRASHDKLLRDFVDRLAHVVVLDPACGSGNFLYVALHLLLDLEKEVITFAANRGVSLLPQVRPTQLHGIEINPYAQQLAQVVIWIGYLQWMRDNGFSPPRNPVLEPIESIRRMDAILDLSDPEHPCEPDWPEAEFIVGNPPFLGGNRIRQGLGDGYVDSLFGIYASRVPAFADLCCYWFQKALAQIQSGAAKRAGLLATQGIRGGVNRSVLDRVKETGDIFFAKSDREWVLDGAWVHVSMVGFDDGSESERVLDGQVVQRIPSNLAIGTDITTAKRLPESANLYHEGTKKGARFELTDADFFRMIVQPNPNGKPNSDVIRLYINGAALYGGRPSSAIIYYPSLMDLALAAQYESPFEHVREHVFPHYGEKRDKWWTHERARPELIALLAQLPRYIATVRHSKHRIFVWLDTAILPDSALGTFASSDDCLFGIVQSRIHEVWSLAQGTQVRERESGFRYTPTSCLQTFPFPDATDGQRNSIAEAARELDRLRNNWLNPPEWTRQEVLEFPGSTSGPWARYVHDPDDRGIGTVRYPRSVPQNDECATQLKKRTLTNLYNQRPTWLDLAHQHLDAAVFAAYGWDTRMSDNDLLAALLTLNLQQAD